jgi:hypothetical protein
MSPTKSKNLSKSLRPNGINVFHHQKVIVYSHMLEFLNHFPINLFFNFQFLYFVHPVVHFLEELYQNNKMS